MPAPISVQLYSLREEAKRDFPAVLERLGRIGFAGVETAGLNGLTPAEVRRRVADAGMAISSTHQPAPIGANAQRILDEQQALGCDTLVVPMAAPERFATDDAVRALAGELAEAHAHAKARGIGLGYTTTGGSSRRSSAGRARTSACSSSSRPRCSPRWTATGRASAAPIPRPWSRGSARARRSST